MMPQKQNCKSLNSTSANCSSLHHHDSLLFGSRHGRHHQPTIESGNNGQQEAQLPFRNAYSETSSNLTTVPGSASRNPIVGNAFQNELDHRSRKSRPAQLILGNQIGHSLHFDFVRPGSYVVNPFLEGTTPNANGTHISRP